MTWPEAFDHAGPWIAFWLAMGGFGSVVLKGKE
jgi:hypothetical protein